MSTISPVAVPLCVDLDGTLIKSDALFESTLGLLKRNPFNFFLILFWLIKGIAYLKSEVAKRIVLDPTVLPYSKTFLAYLKSEHTQGRKLILVTAADKKLAEAIANYLGIFSQVLASDGRLNLKGETKRRLLCRIVGEKQFDYAGNDKNDLKVWVSARQAIIVNASRQLIKQAHTLVTVERIFPREKKTFYSFLQAIRLHQYVKNILIFVPLFASHLYFNAAAIVNSVVACGAFCLIASSVYLTNDLLDLEADRKHRTKHKRPFAAGDLSIRLGIFTIIVFFAISLSLTTLLNVSFLLILICYFLLSSAYSFYLKQKLLVDVFVLAILYTIRILAGVAAIQSQYSEWLMAFSIFFFLSLAFVKRYSELYLSKIENKSHILGRGYNVADLNQLSIFGTVSGYVAVLVFAFYINSNQVASLYRHPQWLWLVCLLLLYWISRIWMLATRGLVNEDPLFYALHDRTSLCTLFAIAITMLMSCL